MAGKPDPPGTQYDDYFPDHQAAEIRLSSADLPPTTNTPAKPGEARVEKSARGASRPASSAPQSAEETNSKPGSVHRFWQAANNNWARYEGTTRSNPSSLVRTAAYGGPGQPAILGYTASGLPIKDLTHFSGFTK